MASIPSRSPDKADPRFLRVGGTPWLAALLASALAAVPAGGGDLPRLVVTSDDTVVTRSCEVVIPAGTVVRDTNTNGVLHVRADGITLRFAEGSELRGAPAGTPWDALRGIGIRVEGHRKVRIVGARVHGFFNGLLATEAEGLVVDGGDYSDNYRQRLRSTPQAEDGADWLFPHNNDEVRWRDQYGGAVCVESSRHVTIRGVRVRRGQNGIVLDRVEDSLVYDNDGSFLSGWGLAMWRSSRNTIARNAFDFCVRGHVEGVYNRGQDAAGILCFEQCNDNVIAENSATHGGDGFFGFAGREALGEHWMNAERQRVRTTTAQEPVEDGIQVPPEVARRFSALGCNRNLLLRNDFSYAAAHGIEMTFSEGNVFAGNRLVENAICGIWGGYSSDTLIVDNEITANGGMAYGLERGGINMEHASGNRILRNRFLDNPCAIHLWWDNDAALLRSPGVAGNDRGVSGNVIAGNRLEVTATPPFTGSRAPRQYLGLQLRDDGGGHLRENRYVANQTRLALTNALEIAVPPGVALTTEGTVPRYHVPRPRLPGRTRPVGARASLRGRDQILLDEWGPWDHESPLVRAVASSTPGRLALEVLGLDRVPEVEILSGALVPSVAPLPQRPGAWAVHLDAPAGVTSYRARLLGPGLDRTLTGTLVSATWDCTFFPWPASIDPRTNLVAWRALSGSPESVRVQAPSLDFPYGWGGPRDRRLSEELDRRGPGGDHFGMIARTRLALPPGSWRFRTVSDDGIRIRVGEVTVLEDWTWHGPTPAEGLYRQAAGAAAEVEVVVEHFEIDGYATLQVSLETAEPR